METSVLESRSDSQNPTLPLLALWALFGRIVATRFSAHDSVDGVSLSLGAGLSILKLHLPLVRARSSSLAHAALSYLFSLGQSLDDTDLDSVYFDVLPPVLLRE